MPHAPRDTNGPLIIGGGLAGLALTLELARAGQAPTLLEASPRLGGRGATDRTDTGHAFDRGAHALFCKGRLEAFLRRHRLHVPGPVATTAGSVVLLDDAVLPLPDGPLDFLRASWLDRWAFARWSTATALGRHPTGGNAAAWLDGALPEGPTRALAHALTRVSTYGGALEQLDAATAAEQVRVGFGGVRYLEGGWQRLVDAVAHAATEAGAQLHTSAPVRALHVDDEGVLVDTDTSSSRTDRIVLALPPDRASALLPSLIRPAPDAVRVAALQLVLAPEVVADGPCQRLAIDLDRPVFVSDFSNVASYGPDDAHVVHAVRYLDDHETGRGSAAMARADMEATLDRLWPRWRDGVRAHRFLPRIATTAVRPRPGIPRPPEQPHPRVWCVGDGYGPHALLADAAVASAERVAVQLMDVPRQAIA